MLISHVLLMMFDWIVIDTPQTRLIDAIKLSAKTMFRDGALFTFLMIYVRFWWIFLFFGFFDFYICTAMAYFYYQYCATNPKQPKKEEVSVFGSCTFLFAGDLNALPTTL